MRPGASTPPVRVDPESLLRGLELEPRPYQLRVVEQAIGALWEASERPARSVLVESPTGSGKTVMGLLVARWIQQVQGWTVGWVAMRRNLLRQAQEENRRRGFGVDLRLISMFDREPPSADLLVVDEAQHDAALSMATLHGVIRPRRILGLSATPYRTDRVKLCFEQVLRDADIHALIQQGYLGRYDH